MVTGITREQSNQLHVLAKQYNFNHGELYILSKEFGFKEVVNTLKYRSHVLHTDSLYNICEEYLEAEHSYTADKFSEYAEMQTY